MKTCTFFGHGDTPSDIQPRLRETVEDLILHHGVTLFYVGNQGNFDAMTRCVLRELQQKYPKIRHAVVLERLPGKPSEYEDYSDTMFPEGLELAHPRYAIAKRNEWMLAQSEYVITYVTRKWGGAYTYADMARKKKKNVIALAEMPCNGAAQQKNRT